MAGIGLLALIDDIASVLDDVAALTKVAVGKTAGVLGDDLALNAHQLTGMRAERELPVVYAVAKGSLRNKAMLVPAALLLSVFAPWAVTPLLMLGGTYLCYEGIEKVAHRWLHDATTETAAHDATAKALEDPTIDIVAFERERIRGAIRTDLVLSIEIIVIALGTVYEAAFWNRALVVAVVAVLMTVGVYGFVALIVRLDDMGVHLIRTARSSSTGAASRALGRSLLVIAPRILRFLSVAGTVAMFLVGGGILVHAVHWLGHPIEELTTSVSVLPGVGPVLAMLVGAVCAVVVGMGVGAIALVATNGVSALVHRRSPGRQWK